jgi:hypothetical protein
MAQPVSGWVGPERGGAACCRCLKVRHGGVFPCPAHTTRCPHGCRPPAAPVCAFPPIGVSLFSIPSGAAVTRMPAGRSGISPVLSSSNSSSVLPPASSVVARSAASGAALAPWPAGRTAASGTGIARRCAKVGMTRRRLGTGTALTGTTGERHDSGPALTQEWRASGGRSGLPVIDLGDTLRVPRRALERMLGVELTGQLPVRQAGRIPVPKRSRELEEAPGCRREPDAHALMLREAGDGGRPEMSGAGPPGRASRLKRGRDGRPQNYRHLCTRGASLPRRWLRPRVASREQRYRPLLRWP